uniref:Uncharacterized protein n=1 Tax=Timema bartmani TaxID=61472 RepID=A0A7R9EQ21_9NEOP|nr:unnamed protein product [Timema bartmani]
MELQIILNDVARIMDIPFNHSNNAQQNTAASQTSPAEGNWSNPISPVSSSSNENFSNDAAEGIFPWGDELRFALDDVKVGYRTAVEGGKIALAAGTRKRKRWCDMDAAPPPQLAKIPSSVVGGQDMGFVDEEVMVEPILADCGTGSKGANNVVVRYKDTKDPLEDSDQHKEADKVGQLVASAPLATLVAVVKHALSHLPQAFSLVAGSAGGHPVRGGPK